MTTQLVPANLKGLVKGITTEKSVLNIQANELATESRNIEMLPDGSIRPRRGVDFISQGDSGNYIFTTRTGSTASEISQESPSAIYAPFRTSTGELLERVVCFQDLKFQVFKLSNLNNYDSPDQTIDPTSTNVNTDQKYYNVCLHFADNKVFFAGRKMRPGYLYLDTDNVTLQIVYLEVHTRDTINNTAASTRRKNDGVLYECIEAHTSSSTNEPGTGSDWIRYWNRLDSTGDLSGETAWATSQSYTTNILKKFPQDSVLGTINPHFITFGLGRLWIVTDDRIYYSRVITESATSDSDTTTANGANEYRTFYQDADPFDTNDNSPVASDGGFIEISDGIGQQIVVLQDRIFYSTTSKIFEIKGVSGKFSNIDFENVVAINEGVNGVNNMVVADRVVYVFGTGNIWVSREQDTQDSTARTKFNTVGNSRIKTYYKAIPRLNKGSGRAVYSAEKRAVYYFHNGTSTNFDNENRNVQGQPGYARNILRIQVESQEEAAAKQEEGVVTDSIQLWEYTDDADSDGAYIAYAFVTPPISDAENTVVVGTDTVLVGTDTVTIPSLSGAEEGQDELIVIGMQRSVSGTTVTIKTAFARLESTALRDWDSDTNLRTNYTAKAFLGTQTPNDLVDKFQVKYLVFIFEKLTDGTGSCKLRTSFDFVSPDSTGETIQKATGEIQIYQDDLIVGSGATVDQASYDYVWKKHRVRGRGRSFQIALYNEANKDFKLMGFGQELKLKRRAR